MATYTSGEIRTTIRPYLDLVLSWRRTGTSGTNSTIELTLKTDTSGGNYPISGLTVDCQIIVNGTTYESNNVSMDSIYGKTLMTTTVSLPANADGTQTLRAFGSIESNIPGYRLSGTPFYYASVGTQSWELPRLFNASNFTIGQSAYQIGSSIPVSITRSNANHRLYFFATLQGTVIDTWNYPTGSSIPSSLGASSRQLNEAPKILTSTDRGVVSLTMETYSGDTLLYSQTITIQGILPASYKPTVTNLLLEAVNPSSVPLAERGTYIQGISQVKVTLVGSKSDDNTRFGDVVHESDWYEIIVDDTLYYGQIRTSNTITKTNIVVKGRLKDSRGRWSDWKQQSLSVEPYAQPTMTKMNAQRYTSGLDASSGNASPAGGNLGIYAEITAKPPFRVAVSSKNNTTGVVTTHLNQTNITNTKYILNRIFAGLSVDDEHIAYLLVEDKYGEQIHWQRNIASGKFTFVLGKDNIGVNKIPTRKGAEIEGDIWLTLGNLYQDGTKIIDIGGNSDGYYAKFASGLLICWKTDLAMGQITTEAGNIWMSGSTTWTFPHAFSLIPYCDGMPRAGRAGAWIALGELASSVTQASFKLYYPWTSATATTAAVFAIGLWK